MNKLLGFRCTCKKTIFKLLILKTRTVKCHFLTPWQGSAAACARKQLSVLWWESWVLHSWTLHSWMLHSHAQN